MKQPGGNEAKAKDFVAKMLANIPVLDSGARGSTVTFAERGVGDVLLTWENEAHLSIKEFGADKFDIVYPPISILAEPPVAVVDKTVDRRGTRAVAQAYLEYLYTPEGQEIAAKNFYRPIDPKVAEKYAKQFPKTTHVHHRRSVRRLGQGAEDALRRRRRVRPDLHPQVASAPAPRRPPRRRAWPSRPGKAHLRP